MRALHRGRNAGIARAGGCGLGWILVAEARADWGQHAGTRGVGCVVRDLIHLRRQAETGDTRVTAGDAQAGPAEGGCLDRLPRRTTPSVKKWVVRPEPTRNEGVGVSDRLCRD